MRIAALALGLVISAGACASSGTAAADQAPTAATTTKRTNVITAQEIRDSKAPSTRGHDSTVRARVGRARPLIAVNNDIMSGYEMLRVQPVSSAKEIIYLSKSEAYGKWGTRVNSEVIQIVTR